MSIYLYVPLGAWAGLVASCWARLKAVTGQTKATAAAAAVATTTIHKG